MLQKATLVIGASEKPDRYSNRAIQLLRKYGHPVWAIGARTGRVLDVSFSQALPETDQIDTVTLYINPSLQKAYYDYILHLKPTRIIFNPGTENETLRSLADAAGIQTLEACTLVMLGTGQY